MYISPEAPSEEPHRMTVKISFKINVYHIFLTKVKAWNQASRQDFKFWGI